ncbi:MAG: hypothetical protein K6A35_05105 [bacterium]|nr:hypothetical protein [bacterium]
MGIIDILNYLGRSLEFALTGQTNYKITTSEFEKASIIDNEVQAALALKEVRQYLKEKFSIVLRQPVVVHLGQPKTWLWKWRLTSGFNHVGNYYSQPMGQTYSHIITIIPKLERTKFKAVLCHELVHAFQIEHNMLRHLKGYREGMSRWVEYHFLIDHKKSGEAKKLRKIGLAILGNMLNKILAYEEKHGRAATCRWLGNLEDLE